MAKNISKKHKYTDYCTCFYVPEKNIVVFYDEIKERLIEKQAVKDGKEADIVMRIWQDNAPKNVIAHILGENLCMKR